MPVGLLGKPATPGTDAIAGLETRGHGEKVVAGALVGQGLRRVLLGTLGLAVPTIAGCHRRAAQPPASRPKAAPVCPVVRPASVAAPTKDRPIVLWRESKGPITDWRGDLTVRYERRAALSGETPTLAVGIDLGAVGQGKHRRLYVYAKRPLPEVTGVIDLSPALGRMRSVLARTCPDLSGKTVLSVTVGAGERGSYAPLSNQVTIRCLLSVSGGTPAAARS
jgi:hypothetical protein